MIVALWLAAVAGAELAAMCAAAAALWYALLPPGHPRWLDDDGAARAGAVELPEVRGARHSRSTNA
jgi:hypothetical protein